MDLIETVDYMLSYDYKDRFKAEYYQLKIRTDKLKEFIKKYEEGTLDFTPSCSLSVFKDQYIYMINYLDILRVRAKIENVELD